MNRFLLWAALAAALLLEGCATIAPTAAPPPAPAFDFLGRISARAEGRVFSSHIRWAHAAGRDEIWLMTPTGQALARIAGDATAATFTAADGGEFQADDMESLMRRALGWELPVSRLAWWVQGGIVPGGAFGEVLRDTEGRLVRLKQDGWNIEITHPPAGGAGRLPARVELADDERRIRLVIDQWRTDAGAR